MRKPLRSLKLKCAPLYWFLPALLTAQSQEPTELEAFISEEIAAEDADSLIPTDRTVDGAFFKDMAVLDTPRSVLSLNPALLKQLRIDDFSDLDKIGASTERYNFFGIAGAPTIRGWQGGVYFNGMLRAYQWNAMPTSFGSLEAMDIIKGPAPAQYVATHVAGFANMIPKSPYYDQSRGSIEVELGSFGSYQGQVDVGGPLLLGDVPAAFRVSVTAQDGDSFYDDVSNDYYSVYAAVKVKLSNRLRLFAGGEYYDFKSNENAGWNRPTQNLIDKGDYVIGEPLSLVNPLNGGVADRGGIDSVVYDFSWLTNQNNADFRALVVPDAVINEAITTGALSAAQVAAMKDMSNPQVRTATYAGLGPNIVQTSSGYLYTPEYFNLGGVVFTAPIDGSTALADPSDFADSEDAIFFFDLTYDVSDTLTIENKFFAEALNTDKRSSYGYSFRSEQEVYDNRLSFVLSSETDGAIAYEIIGGVQTRFSHVIQLEDYWTEPFARRDITRSGISPNSIILTGAQADPSFFENNYWGGGFGGAGLGTNAAESDLLQIAAFGVVKVDYKDLFSIIFSTRHERADFEVKTPGGPTDIPFETASDEVDYTNWSVNPVIKLTPELSLYGAIQETTTFVPGDGGVVLNAANFGDGSLREVGFKYSFLDGRGFATLSAYRWEQTAFSNQSGVEDPYTSEGIEVELSWAVSESLTVLASYSDRETKRLVAPFFRAMPWGLADPTGANNEEIGVALEGGALYNSDVVSGDAQLLANNPDLIVPGAPESSFKLYAVYDLPKGFQIAGGGIYRSSFWHNYDRTLKIDSSLVFNARLGWRSERVEINLSIENLFNEDYYLGADPDFGANTLITKAPETEAVVSFKYQF